LLKTNRQTHAILYRADEGQRADAKDKAGGYKASDKAGARVEATCRSACFIISG